MTWKPTEGLRRAEHIVRALAEDGAECHNNIGPILQHRMMHVIARAIDVALEDGMLPVRDEPLAATSGGWDGDLYRDSSGKVTKVKLHKDEHETIPGVAEAQGISVEKALREAAEHKIETLTKKRGRKPKKAKKARRAAAPEAAAAKE